MDLDDARIAPLADRLNDLLSGAGGPMTAPEIVRELLQDDHARLAKENERLRELLRTAARSLEQAIAARPPPLPPGRVFRPPVVHTLTLGPPRFIPDPPAPPSSGG